MYPRLFRRPLPLLSVLLAVAFATVLLTVLYGPPFLMAFDTGVLHAVQVLQTPGGLTFFSIITNFGGLFGVLVVFGTMLHLYRHRPDVIARLAIALLGITVTGEYLKDMVHRVRPEVYAGYSPILSYSFPSGHSGESMVMYGYLALLLYVHAPSTARKVAAILVPIILILVIGLSRIVLQYHYASDVLGGYLLGGFWLTFSLAVPLYYEVYHQDPSHTEPVIRPLV